MNRLIILLLAVVITFSMALPGRAEEKVQAPSNYKVGPGDVLNISVWQDERLNHEIVVPPDRIISYPLAGDIDVTDMTVAQLREVLTKKISAYIPDASVAVLLIKTGSLTAFVIGKVNSPGQFPITSDTTVMQVLAMAGGLNPYASSSSILIIRQKDGETIQFPFDYDEVKRGKNLEQNIALQRGDVVIVP